MVLAKERLFVAGPPDVVDPEDLMGAFEGRKGAVLRTYSAADGKMLSEMNLDAPPVFDGLIAAGGRLYLREQDRLYCYDVRAPGAEPAAGPDSTLSRPRKRSASARPPLLCMNSSRVSPSRATSRST